MYKTPDFTSSDIHTDGINMAPIRFVLLVFAVISGVQAETQFVDLSPLVNCTNGPYLIRLQQKCFDIYNVPVTLPDYDMMTNASVPVSDRVRNILLSQDIDSTRKICNNLEPLVKAYLCSRQLTRKCGLDIPILESMLPPEDKFRKQQAYTCANIHNYNFSCVKTALLDVADCVNTTGMFTFDVFNMNVTEFVEKITCVSYEMASVCAERYIKPCGELTFQMYEVSQPDTSVCKTATDTNSHFVDEVVDCSDKKSVRKGYLTCLVDSGITLLVPQFDTSEDTAAFIMKSMTTSHSKQMCSNLAAYKEAINCTLNIQTQCSDDVMKPTVPDSHTVQQGFDTVCGNIDDFDGACVMKNTNSACAARRKRSFAQQIILRHLCGDDDFRQKCLLSVTGPCGTKTVSLYKQILKSQSPAKCLNDAPLVPVIG